MKKLKLMLFIGLLALTMGLAGCADDGSNGAAGAPGADGADGADVTVETLAGLGLVFAEDVEPMNPTLDLSQTVDFNATTGALSIHFFLTDEAGDGIDVTKLPYELRLYVSELLPSVDVADNPGAAWNQLISERGTPAAGSAMPGTLTLVDAATGEYTYVPAATLAASTNVTRVTMRARMRFRDADNNYIVVANPVNASYDFLQADAGTALASSGADMVTTASCEKCHGARIGDVGHGGGYTQVKTCNACHNLNYLAAEGDPLEADLAYMIHAIHAAKNIVGLADFTEVTYPQEIYACGTCHDGAQAALAYSTPTRSNCGSCHDNVNFVDGTGHAGGAIDDDRSCKFCHSAAAIENIYHKPAPSLANTPEFDVTISMSAPAVGTFYTAGDTPVVTVTLAAADGGSEVNYSAVADAKGTRDGNLSAATLYVYGPRAHAVPVLTEGSTTDLVEVIGDVDVNAVMIGNDDGFCDPAEELIAGACVPGKDQTSALFFGSLGAGGVVDAQVLTPVAGATAFTYQLQDVDGLEAGTYMVRFEGGDYGAISDTDYVTASTAVINFQVGTAVEEPKLAGSACIDCHGDTRMHLEGAHPHNTAFDTDDCLACHDFSGNYGDYIGNRVHAVHRASVTGDTHARDWSEVTYPQPANNCTVCHTNADADTPVWRTPSMLACGGCHGADPAVVPADFPLADADRIMIEAAAAQHMAQNGGTIDPTVSPTLSCLVCHGEGRTADLAETHDLNRFRALPVDPNE